MFQQGLQLIFKNFMKSLSFWIIKIAFAQLFYALDEEVQLLKDLFKYLNILIINWFMEQIVQTEPARDHQHQTFI